MDTDTDEVHLHAHSIDRAVHAVLEHVYGELVGWGGTGDDYTLTITVAYRYRLNATLDPVYNPVALMPAEMSGNGRHDRLATQAALGDVLADWAFATRASPGELVFDCQCVRSLGAKGHKKWRVVTPFDPAWVADRGEAAR